MSFFNKNLKDSYRIEGQHYIISFNEPGPLTASRVETIMNNRSIRSRSNLYVEIGERVTSIEDNAFNWKYKILKFTISPGIRSIGGGAFANCHGISKIEIPEGVVSLGCYAFASCPALSSVVIPSTLEKMSTDAFLECKNLSSVSIAEKNPYFNSIDNVVYTKDSSTLVLYPSGKRNMSFTIPSGVKSIGKNAMCHCSYLKKLTISKDTEQIAPSAFNYSKFIESIEVEEGNKAYKSIDGSLYNADGSELIRYAVGGLYKSFTFHDELVSIRQEAFRDSRYLTSIEIPKTITSIGSLAFMDCNELTIYCEAEEKPQGWSDSWNYSERPVIWGHKIARRKNLNN